MADEEQGTSGMPNELELLKRRADLMGIAYSNNIGAETLRARIAEKLGDGEDEGDETDTAGDDEGEASGESQGEQAPEVNGFEAAADVAKAKESVPAVPAKPTVAEIVEQASEVKQDAEEAGAPLTKEAILEALGLSPEIIAAAIALKNGGGVAAAAPVAAPVSKTKQKAQLRKKIHDENMRLVRVRITCMDPKKKDLEGEIITVSNKFIGNVKRFIPFGEKTEDGWHIPYVIYKMLKRRQFVNIRITKDKRTGYERVERTMAKEFAIEVLPPLTEGEIQQLATAQLAAGSLD